ncbi:toll/interleukin-1 receptor domain-containing protein [Geotalea toluenoxydans]|uniref:toll/interleukin-1 receptor domain-containing protein n=1 Tax=Geotalea toluenoxydans TaxID=421624 RepID=UPI0006D11538|nr:toll/interleukin-1 receptor domain-containing protein [Geotalea toluenoxydans]
MVDIWTEMLQAMRSVGVDPAIVYATAKTGMMVSSDNRHLFSGNDLRKWNRAIQEYDSITVPNNILTSRITAPSYHSTATYDLPASPVVFLSYCWKDGGIANVIYEQFNQFNLKVRKDNIDISYKKSIREYMSKVRKCDYVLMLLSKNYFRSCNCILEALDIAVSTRFREQILPIVLDSYNLFAPQERIRLLKYWDSKIEKMAEAIKSLNNYESITALEKELETYHKIRAGLDSLLSALSDMKMPTLKDLVATGYEEILKVIASSESAKISHGIRILNTPDPYLQMSKLSSFKNLFSGDKYPTFLEGVITYKARSLDIAAECFERVISEWPEYEPAYIELAILNIDKGNFDYAQHLLEQVLRINTTNAIAMYNLGCLFCKLERKNAAIDWFKAAISVNTQDSDAFQNIGAILYDLKQYKDSCKYLVRAIELNPLDAKAHLNLGRLLSDPFMRHDEAKNSVEKII